MQTQMIPVQSSMFSAIGYDAERMEFLAQYNTGTLGAYHPTTLEEFNRVAQAESVGKAFNALIRPSKRFRKVEDEPTPLPVEQQKRGLDDGPANSIIQHNKLYVDDKPEPLRITEVPAAEPAEETEVKQKTDDIALRATTFEVLSHESHVQAQELVVDISTVRKQVTDFFAPMKKAAHEAHKAVCDRENETLSPLLAAQKALGNKIVAFETRVREQAKREEERLRAERQAEEDRRALEESERLALEDAVELEAQGDIAGAEAVLANPVPVTPRYVPPPVVHTGLTRVSGAVGRTIWKARVTNPALVPREYLIVDESALNKIAGALRERARVPGVEFYPDSSVHGRASR